MLYCNSPALDDTYLQGEIVEVDFGESMEYENSGVCQSLIISNNKGNTHSTIVTVIPYLNETRKLKLNKISTVDRKRIIGRVDKLEDIEIIKQDILSIMDNDFISKSFKRKKKTRKYRRGEIVLCDLGINVGSEQNGIRPVIILQNEILRFREPTFIVAPITNSYKNHIPTQFKIGEELEVLNDDSAILFEQVKCINKKRIIKDVGYVNIDENVQIRGILERVLFK